jgi:hypothetical protein
MPRLTELVSIEIDVSDGLSVAGFLEQLAGLLRMVKGGATKIKATLEISEQ